MKRLIISFVCWQLFCSLASKLAAQTYYGCNGGFFYQIDVTPCSCTVTTLAPSLTPNPNNFTICPDGTFYYLSGNPSHVLYQVDITTGSQTVVMTNLPPANFVGLACAGGGIFYAMDDLLYGTTLYQINMNAGTSTALGDTGIPCTSDMAYYNGVLYYNSYNDLVQVDLANPANSTVVLSLNTPMKGISPYNSCNILLAMDVFSNQLILLNMLDGTMTPLCSSPNQYLEITSLTEFTTPPCTLSLDLDCDDSSGASGNNFNGPTVNCLSQAAAIADDGAVDCAAGSMVERPADLARAAVLGALARVAGPGHR